MTLSSRRNAPAAHLHPTPANALGHSTPAPASEPIELRVSRSPTASPSGVPDAVAPAAAAALTASQAAFAARPSSGALGFELPTPRVSRIAADSSAPEPPCWPSQKYGPSPVIPANPASRSSAVNALLSSLSSLHSADATA